MNEIRDLIIGIDFGKKKTQICYYDRKAQEARSLSVKVGASLYESPSCLLRRPDKGSYCVGLEAEYFAREKGGVLIDDLYEICQKTDKVSLEGEEKEPWELFAAYLRGMLKFLGILDVVKNIKCLTLTCETLGGAQVDNFQKAVRYLGFSEEKFLLMDYGESFYYYVLGQKRETWNRSVAWYEFAPAGVSFRKMSMNGSHQPVLVKISQPESVSLDERAEVRDLEFAKFVQDTIGTELYSSVQITGEGFDTSWAVQSVKLLCHQKRKVFYGNNLFAKGACMAGKEQLEDKALKGYRYLSDALVLTDVGMEMRIMGAPAYYPLLEAGRNWYESRAYCELILDNVKELVFLVENSGEKEKKRVAMQLTGLPARPNKTTRLSLEMNYVSPRDCRILVKDLGFGEMYPTSGKVWKETVQW